MLRQTVEQRILGDCLLEDMLGNHTEIQVPFIRDERFLVEEYDSMVIVSLDPFEFVSTAPLGFDGNRFSQNDLKTVLDIMGRNGMAIGPGQVVTQHYFVVQ